MDDKNVARWVGALALGLVLAAVAWLLVSPSPGTSGGNDQVRVSDRQLSLSAHYRALGLMQRCIDAAAARGVSGCVAASFGPSAPPTPSDRRLQRSTRPGAVGVTPVPIQVPAPSAPATLQPATLQPATPPPATPPSPAPTRRPVPRNGPVPGGNTSPPHTGPSP
jgi:hypothetical protein